MEGCQALLSSELVPVLWTWGTVSFGFISLGPNTCMALAANKLPLSSLSV